MSELSRLIADVKEQVLYLQELGVDVMPVDLPENRGSELISELMDDSPSVKKIALGISEIPNLDPKTAVSSKPPASRLASLPSLSNRASSRKSGADGAAPIRPLTDPKSSINVSVVSDETEHGLFGEVGSILPKTGETIEAIRAEIGNCTRCPLHAGRTQIVHSTGNFNADLMFVGEAPGADEDEQGFPFVGRAGQLLTKIIEGIGIKREEVFIGNINRCRPPGNRQPTLPEAETCRPYLQREIAVVRPKVIVVMGNTATQNLLNTKVGITRLRGTFQDYLGVKLMPTFHPAYLLRDPNKKREVWDDMKQVRDYLNAS